jgi:hypothetical protein
MGFAGTKRNHYTQVKIQKMRSERKTKKAKVDGVPDSSYIRSMGDLIGAGHLRFVGVSNVNIKTEDIILPQPGGKLIKKKIELQKPDRENIGLGEGPDMMGYLASGHPKDPMFQLKGWVNEDGSIRLELVTAYGNI